MFLTCGSLLFLPPLVFLNGKKGFFPHLFNMQDHQEYVGPILDIVYYDPEGMSAKKRQEFETWYATQLQEEVNFNLKEELIAYCKSDVALLKAGCQVCVLKPVVLHHYVRAEYEVYHKTMRATDAHTTITILRLLLIG